jgi:hypothetical protein
MGITPLEMEDLGVQRRELGIKLFQRVNLLIVERLIL